MVSRREKLSRSYFRLREQTFHKQVAVLSLSDFHKNVSSAELVALRDANHGPNIYDIMYSRGEVAQKEDFGQVIQLIGGVQLNASQMKKVLRLGISLLILFNFTQLICFQDKNGVVGRINHGLEDNPYKRTYMNGSESRRSRSLSSISAESTASDSEVNSTWRREVISFIPNKHIGL